MRRCKKRHSGAQYWPIALPGPRTATSKRGRGIPIWCPHCGAIRWPSDTRWTYPALAGEASSE